jgi:condensation domain-containing protein/AMP-binding enzyme
VTDNFRVGVRRRPRVARVNARERLPLSFGQSRLWCLDKIAGTGAVYNVPLAWRLSGVVNAQALSLALRDVMLRHESLRTVFVEVNGEPEQRVIDARDIGLALIPKAIDAEEVNSEISTLASRTFDLQTDLPLRAELLMISGDESVLVIVVHHIAIDGWSMKPFMGDLSAAYHARVEGTAPAWAPLPVQYGDYAIWQREMFRTGPAQGILAAEQIEFWMRVLKGIPEQISLPADRPRPAVASYRGATIEFMISPVSHVRLLGLAREQACTLFMVLQAALAVLLSAYGAGDDIPLGTASAGRCDERLEDLVGFFAGTMVLRTDVSGNPPFRKLLGRVRDADLDAYSHDDLPFDRLVEALNPKRSAAYNPLFQVLAVFHDGTVAYQPRFNGVRAESIWRPANSAKFDLSIDFVELRNINKAPLGLRTVLEYATDMFNHDTVREIGYRLLRLLDSVTADPYQPIAHLDFISAAERRQQLVDWNGTPREERPVDIHAIVRRIARHRPDDIAVSDRRGSISYEELAGKSSRVAQALAEAGAGTDSVVAVLSDRSAWYVAAVLGVLTAGSAFMPLEAGTPVPRSAQMLRDSGAHYLAVAPQLRQRAEEIAGSVTMPPAIVRLDGAAGGFARLRGLHIRIHRLSQGRCYTAPRAGQPSARCD